MSDIRVITADAPAIDLSPGRPGPPLSAPGQRIGLLGGSFNPPHAAHRLISHTAIKRLQLDCVWWLVTPGNPLKSSIDMPPLEVRMAAAAACAQDSRIKVTGFEQAFAVPYTVTTLTHLLTRCPGVHFVWLMGADNLAQMHRWRQWRRLFQLMPVAVIDRPGWHLKSLAGTAARTMTRSRWPEAYATGLPGAHPPAWTFLTGPLSVLSSTAIRAHAIAVGSAMTPPET